MVESGDQNSYSRRPKGRQELQSRIVAKARQDQAFKQALLANPTETILKELGLEELPEHPSFQVLEETPDTLYLVLPLTSEQRVALAEGEEPPPANELLSDDELESVAGQAVLRWALTKTDGTG